MKRWRQNIIIGFAVCFISACAVNTRYVSDESKSGATISSSTLNLNSTVPKLDFSQGVLFTDNDDAFLNKLDIINKATQRIDLAYYIFSDDDSSSVLGQALIDAAKRGVEVRLITDLHTNYKNLDYFSMLEREGAKGKGSLHVRFYDRPTRNIVKDAVYVTIGCGEAKRDVESEHCSSAKFAELDKLFDDETIGGVPVGERNISNLNLAKSGLFLSGLYSKNPNIMSLAIMEGQGIDKDKLKGDAAGASDEQKLEQLKKLGKIYLRANFTGGFDSLVAKIELSVAFGLYGKQINPVFEAFTGFLPVERQGPSTGAERDWRFLTDFLHHKFLLVDEKYFQLGGRNVENSYHMHQNALTHKYVFMDTDAYLELTGGGNALTHSFDALWNFDLMMARISDIRQFAPNDMVVASHGAGTACAHIKTDKQQHQACMEKALPIELAKTLDQRMDERLNDLQANANTYRQQYEATPKSNRQPQFVIDKNALISYVENLPFYKASPDDVPSRSYGAINGQEGESGKHIHNIWLTALRNTCASATAEQPQRVILHNAYYFLPSNLLSEFAQIVDGRRPCGHVKVDILTNSIETTDLNVVNLLSRHSMKAFGEYYKNKRDINKGAVFAFYEYVPPKTANKDAVLSLHTKVEVFGKSLFVGSANADVRSYMKDSNNGLFIRNAENLVANYSNFVDGLIQDGSRIVEVTQVYLQTPRETLLAEDMVTVAAIMAKYRAERWIKEESQLQSIEQIIKDALEKSYTFSVEAVKPCRAFCDAPDSFNMMFKTI